MGNKCVRRVQGKSKSIKRLVVELEKSEKKFLVNASLMLVRNHTKLKFNINISKTKNRTKLHGKKTSCEPDL